MIKYIFFNYILFFYSIYNIHWARDKQLIQPKKISKKKSSAKINRFHKKSITSKDLMVGTFIGGGALGSGVIISSILSDKKNKNYLINNKKNRSQLVEAPENKVDNLVKEEALKKTSQEVENLKVILHSKSTDQQKDINTSKKDHQLSENNKSQSELDNNIQDQILKPSIDEDLEEKLLIGQDCSKKTDLNSQLSSHCLEQLKNYRKTKNQVNPNIIESTVCSTLTHEDLEEKQLNSEKKISTPKQLHTKTIHKEAITNPLNIIGKEIIDDFHEAIKKNIRNLVNHIQSLDYSLETIFDELINETESSIENDELDQEPLEPGIRKADKQEIIQMINRDYDLQPKLLMNQKKINDRIEKIKTQRDGYMLNYEEELYQYIQYYHIDLTNIKEILPNGAMVLTYINKLMMEKHNEQFEYIPDILDSYGNNQQPYISDIIYREYKDFNEKYFAFLYLQFCSKNQKGHQFIIKIQDRIEKILEEINESFIISIEQSIREKQQRFQQIKILLEL